MDLVTSILKPSSLADIFVYLIFFGALAVLFVMPEKNETPMYLLFGIIFCCILDFMRTRVDRFPIPGSEPNGFFTYNLQISMALITYKNARMIMRRR
jgi:hypothetical protein